MQRIFHRAEVLDRQVCVEPADGISNRRRHRFRTRGRANVEGHEAGPPRALAVREEIHGRRISEIRVLEVSDQADNLDIECWGAPRRPFADSVASQTELPRELLVDDRDFGCILRITRRQVASGDQRNAKRLEISGTNLVVLGAVVGFRSNVQSLHEDFGGSHIP